MPPSAARRFQTDLFIPAYRPARRGRWELRIGGMTFAPGDWSGPVLVESMAREFR